MPKISPTLNCINKVNERKNKGLPIYNFGLGANPIDQPEKYIDNVKKFSHKKEYTSAKGIDELNEVIKKTFTTENYMVENVLVGNGLKELLFIIQLCFKGKIYHVTPSWVSYKEQIDILNKTNDLIEIETTIENSYKINPKKLDEILNRNKNESKLIIFNNPNNPTGLIQNPDEVKEIAHILKKHNCIVFADEIYFNISHFNSICSISDYIPELTIRGSSVSKDLGCGGYRIGWVTFPKQLNNFYLECLSVSSSIYSCAATPLQYATCEILKNTDIINNHCKYQNNIYSTLVSKVCNILDKSNLKYVKPNAAWYIFINFDYYKEKITVDNSIKLNNFLLDKFGIVGVAGECFNSKGLNIRFSLVEIDTNNLDDFDLAFKKILEGFNILVKYFNSL